MPVQRNKTEEDITAEVLRRFAETPDPRLRQIMLGLVKHLHAFVNEVELTAATPRRAGRCGLGASCSRSIQSYRALILSNRG